MSRSFFGILYFYFWYSYTILVSNDCISDINPYGLFSDCVYFFQSHLSISIGMVIRCFLVTSYMCATSFCICCVCMSILISFLGLHSFVKICMGRMINGRGKYLVSVFFSSLKFAFIMFL